MPKVEKHFLILISTLLVFLLINSSLTYYNKRPLTNIDLTRIPLTIGGWQGKEIPTDESVSAILETDSVLMRQYKKGKETIFLAIVYYKDSKVAFHLPESCLTGGGSRLVGVSKEKMTGKNGKRLKLNRLDIKNGPSNQVMLYYYKAGETRTDSYQMLRWVMVKNRITGLSNSGALVRLSMPAESLDLNSRLPVLVDFIEELDPILSGFLI
jgi:EpsI family protein